MTNSEHSNWLKGIHPTTTPCADDLDYVAEHGCVAHKDDVAACDGPTSPQWYTADGDLWCDAAYRQFAADGAVIDFVPLAGPYGTVAGSAEALWIEANVGLN